MSDIMIRDDEYKVSEMTEYEEQCLPSIILHDVVAFPGCSIDFDILGTESEKSVISALKNDKMVFLITENTEGSEDNPFGDESMKVYSVGVIAKITQHMKTSDHINRISVECYRKAVLERLERRTGGKDPCLLAYFVDFPAADSEGSMREVKAAMRNVKGLFSEWAKFTNISEETIRIIREEKNPDELISRIAFCGCFETDKNQSLLETKTILDSLEFLATGLAEEIEIAGLQRALLKQAEINLDTEKREQIIKEQINILSSQLENEPDFGGADEEDQYYVKKINELIENETSKEHLLKEAAHYEKLPSYSQESYVIKNYLDTVLSLPWKKEEGNIPEIEFSKEVLERDHYGMKKVKERIVETLAVQQKSPGSAGNIICLVGPPGTGKTSVARSVAAATDRKYVRVSLGGVRDEADIRGHRKTYLGSMPGRIAAALIQVKSNRPVMLLDEIDKMSQDFKGDPSAAMLEVLDSEQNKAFVDHYVEVPFDLSDVMFIATANDLSNVPQPLLDRMEIIELSSYTREEKFQIAKRHLIPKQLEKHGLKKAELKISDTAVYELIDHYTKEAGVRELERYIAALCRKADMKIVSGEAKSLSVSVKKIGELLGARKFHEEETAGSDTVGLVNGLAWTAVGGVLLPIEALVMKGKGRVQLTGSLGDVMQESAKIAITYARTKAAEYGYNDCFIDESDVYIHAPEGAVPKDGPSAGVTMATAVISALSGRKVRKDVAMTGEISLHGDVLPIGGLREKTMAAYRAGIKTIIVPYKNKPDMEEVDEKVKENTEFVFAKKIDDVLKTALKG